MAFRQEGGFSTLLCAKLKIQPVWKNGNIWVIGKKGQMLNQISPLFVSILDSRSTQISLFIHSPVGLSVYLFSSDTNHLAPESEYFNFSIFPKNVNLGILNLHFILRNLNW
jgi:hypothetical protein